MKPVPPPDRRPPTRKRSGAPVEPKPASDHLDFRFLRTCSAMEKVHGELLHRCAGCLWYYPSLASLQNHIQLGWREGFGCRLYYKKLKEIRCRGDVRSLRGGPLEASGKLHTDRFPLGNHMTRKGRDLRCQSGSAGEIEQRNREVQKWLSEIEDPTSHLRSGMRLAKTA